MPPETKDPRDPANVNLTADPADNERQRDKEFAAKRGEEIKDKVGPVEEQPLSDFRRENPPRQNPPLDPVAVKLKRQRDEEAGVVPGGPSAEAQELANDNSEEELLALAVEEGLNPKMILAKAIAERRETAPPQRVNTPVEGEEGNLGGEGQLGGEPPVKETAEMLVSKNNREQLNRLAKKEGITDPEGYANKDDLAEAIIVKRESP